MPDIYESFLPQRWYYAFHLLAWLLPIVVAQWLFFRRLLWAHRMPLLWTTLALGTYLIATDVVAVLQGIWYFNENLILGFSPLGVPIEEWGFFYLTVLLVAQSFILFLPARYRLEPNMLLNG